MKGGIGLRRKISAFVATNQFYIRMRRKSMIIVCNMWMICLELNWFFYDPSWMLQLSEFVWTLRFSVWVVFNNFLLTRTTDRGKIRSDQKRLFFVVSLYPLSFFASTPFKMWKKNRWIKGTVDVFWNFHKFKKCVVSDSQGLGND